MSPSVADKNKSVMFNGIEWKSEPGIYRGRTKTDVVDPFSKDSKEKIEREGYYEIPIATNLDQANSIVKGNEQELLFWFNYGRKVQARAQMTQSLKVDLGDDHKSFENALKNMVDENTPPERVERVKQFILGEPKFAALREKMEQARKEGFGTIFLDFSKEELKKPTGVRGRQKSVKPGETPTETDSDEDESENEE